MLEGHKCRLENYVVLPHTGIAIYSFLILQLIFTFVVPAIEYHFLIA